MIDASDVLFLSSTQNQYLNPFVGTLKTAQIKIIDLMTSEK
jgi:hypothetical protein